MNLSPLAKQKFFDSNGAPMPGGQVFTYAAGTTTKIDTYRNSSGTLNPNPIVLDYRGECDIWLDPTLTYKFTLAPPGDTDPPTKPIWTVDNIAAPIDITTLTQTFLGRILYPLSAAEASAGITEGMLNLWLPYGWVTRFKAVGDDATDNTLFFQRAIAAAGAVGGTRFVYVPAGVFRVGIVGDVPFAVKFLGDGGQASIIKKVTTGVCFTVKAFYVEWRDLSSDADVATNTAYGTSGAFIDYPTGFSSADGRMINFNSQNIDTVVRFAGDAGSRHQVVGGYWIPFTTTAGAEGKVWQGGNGGTDTGAAFRSIVGLTTDGQIDSTGTWDTDIAGTSCRRVISTSTTNLLCVMGGIWGSLGIGVTVDGQNVRIMGVRVSGNITLANTMSGACAFIGNVQTAGTFTDNSPAQVCMVMHHPLGAGFVNINKQTVTQSLNAEEIQTFRVGANSGDADTNLTLDQSQTMIMYNTPLTAARNVNMPASARPGKTFRVVRQAGCTGAFNLNVNGPGLLKALTAASTWCDVTWSGPAGAFVLTANGTL